MASRFLVVVVFLSSLLFAWDLVMQHMYVCEWVPVPVLVDRSWTTNKPTVCHALLVWPLTISSASVPQPTEVLLIHLCTWRLHSFANLVLPSMPFSDNCNVFFICPVHSSLTILSCTLLLLPPPLCGQWCVVCERIQLSTLVNEYLTHSVCNQWCETCGLADVVISGGESGLCGHGLPQPTCISQLLVSPFSWCSVYWYHLSCVSDPPYL